ncbi:MAG: CPBP family intramembrane metalloprotease [Acidobacteriaceae bacterium]|nr:CPBP family intramembrane metalloprotease [Acidobacteriaceae bacterium]
MPERLRGSDYRFLAICLLLLTAAVWFSARYFYRAFPEASIDFRVTREQARARAETFLAAQGLRVDGYRAASRFSYDTTAKTFLEREMGLRDANRLMSTDLRLWRWSWRWFRPLEQEEFRVDITTSGELVGFQHEIPEAAPGLSLPADQARALSERFLRDTLHRDLATLDFLERSSNRRAARTDHTFTWKEHGLDIHDADYRLEVTVLGNQVGGYREYLKVPESWERAYERIRSRNLTAQTIDQGFIVLLGVGLLVTIVLRLRVRDIRWRLAVAVGGTGAVLYFLASWNAYPLSEFYYSTTDSYLSFIAQQLLHNLAGAVAAGGTLFVMTAGAEPLYRRHSQTQLPLGTLFSPHGLRTKQFFLGTILGLTLAGIFVAYQTVFYMLAYRFGAWSPADVPYDDLLNTRLPWLFVLFSGFLPAVSEEFVFRMFAIPFLTKLLRYAPVAVVIAALIWGFGHAAYPEQPYWIRGVEVGIGGVALGVIMLRWGILPTLVWHYSVDALYSALLLLRSHHPYFVLSGAASAGIMVLPALIAAIAYIRRGGFVPVRRREPEPILSPASSPQPLPQSAEELTYIAWNNRRRGAAMLVLLVAAVCIVAIHVQDFGGEPPFAIGPTRARALATQFAREHGFDPSGYRSVVAPITRWDENESRLAAKYFVQRRDIAYVAQTFQRNVPLHAWRVRFFKPLAPEEMWISVDPQNGSVFQFNHILPEDQPGRDLSPENARDLASHSPGLPPLNGFDLVESQSEKKKARRDYTLIFEARPGDARNVDEANFRVGVSLAGDRVTLFRPFWKLPERFERARIQRNGLSYALLVLRITAAATLLLVGLWVLVDRTWQRVLRWGRALRLAVPFGGITFVGMALNFPLLLGQYPTAYPLESFMVITGVELLIRALAMFIALVCSAALIVALRPDAVLVLGPAARRLFANDALFATGVAVVLTVALNRLQWVLIDRFHAEALLTASARTAFATLSPAVSGIAAACQETLFWLALLVLITYVVQWLERWRGAAILAGLVAAAAVVPDTVHTAGEFFASYAIRLLYLAAAVLFVKYVVRGNYLAYLLIAWTLSLVEKGADLLSQTAAPLLLQGGILMALLLGTLVWAWLPAFSRAPSSSASWAAQP